MTREFYGIPDLSEVSKISYPVVWQDREYSFTIYNNNRSEEMILSISTLDENDNEVSIASNINLVVDIDLLSWLKSEYINGRLYLMSDDGSSFKPTYLDISDKYSFLFITEDEFEEE